MKRMLKHGAAAAAALAASFEARGLDENDVLICAIVGSPSLLATGGIDGISGQIVVPVRVFTESAEIPGTDDWRGDEGFFAVTSSAPLPAEFEPLPASADVRFDFRAFTIGGLTSNLWHWDPAAHAMPAFAPVSQGQRLSLRKSPSAFFNATVDGAADDVEGFVIDRTSPEGLLHRHLTIVLDDADEDGGTPIPGGVYAVSLAISHASGAAPPIFELIGGGEPAAGEDDLAAARAYFEAWLDGAACPGDVNGDGAVDLADLSSLLAHFGIQSGAAREDGDLDGDGDVDLADLATVLARFGASCP